MENCWIKEADCLLFTQHSKLTDENVCMQSKFTIVESIWEQTIPKSAAKERGTKTELILVQLLVKNIGKKMKSSNENLRIWTN